MVEVFDHPDLLRRVPSQPMLRQRARRRHVHRSEHPHPAEMTSSFLGRQGGNRDLQAAADGIGWDVYEEKYWDHRLITFEYAYVGLPGLDGEQYVAGEHLLGVALTALMRVPPARRAEVHAEALRRLAEARENDYRRYLLFIRDEKGSEKGSGTERLNRLLTPLSDPFV